MTDHFPLAPSQSASLYRDERPVTAVIGPTNTGKTHYAIERMLAYKSGMIGFPLRLLAREVYDRLLTRRPASEIALVTGEEKIIPRKPKYWICTVEAMPLSEPVDFMAIDEVQLAANPERGRVFTSRLLYARGKAETLFLGSDTMAGILRHMFPNINFLGRERFSTLSYAGSKKITRLPRRSAIVTFSADNVYAIAELVRRQRGGAAVILGALSPRTRNAQAALYQEGEVDYLIATDAIGMGLNMDIDHVAFAGRRKFDGRNMRNLTNAESAQIAGRAGRYMRDGTFGITADCPDFDDETIEAIEEHRFEPVTGLFWRAEALDFASLPALLNSLEKPPLREDLIRARPDDDERALAYLIKDHAIANLAKGGAALGLLWEICQIPDFRKATLDQHAKLLGDIFLEIMHQEKIREGFLAPNIEPLDRIDGDIDTLSARIAHIRSWTYLSNRSSWIDNAGYWQERTRTIEDKLSDALHERLTARFVDRRTAVLLKRLKDNAPLIAGVNEDGEVIVEGQFVGRLLGFEFIIDPRANAIEAKPVRAAAEKALRPVLAARASALANADANDLSLQADGSIMWRSSIVAKLEKGPTPLRPSMVIRNLDMLPPVLRGRVEDRLTDYLAARVEGLLGPLIALQQACDATGEDAFDGLTRSIAYRLVENFGATSRNQFGDDLKKLEQKERGKLRKLGVRFGEFTLFMPVLLKPAPASFLTLLWALWNDRDTNKMTPPKAGLVSTPIENNVPHAYYYASGYRPSGNRAVRIDMLERLAGEIRTARDNSDRREGFAATTQMMSLVGCSGEDFDAILSSLGFRKNIVKRKAGQTAQEASESTPEEPSATPSETPSQTSGETKIASSKSDNAISQKTPPEEEIEKTSSLTPPVSDAIAPPKAETQPVNETAEEQNQSGASKDKTETPQITSEKIAESVSKTLPGISTENPSAEEQAEIEITLWRFQAKRPPRKYNLSKKEGSKDGQKRKPFNNGGKNGGKKGTKSSDDKNRNPYGKNTNPKDRKPKNPHMNKPRHLKVADPDSPFAVLAALKDNKNNS